jgi:hypothetical protein
VPPTRSGAPLASFRAVARTVAKRVLPARRAPRQTVPWVRSSRRAASTHPLPPSSALPPRFSRPVTDTHIYAKLLSILGRSATMRWVRSSQAASPVAAPRWVRSSLQVASRVNGFVLRHGILIAIPRRPTAYSREFSLLRAMGGPPMSVPSQKQKSMREPPRPRQTVPWLRSSCWSAGVSPVHAPGRLHHNTRPARPNRVDGRPSRMRSAAEHRILRPRARSRAKGRSFLLRCALGLVCLNRRFHYYRHLGNLRVGFQ